VVGWPSTGGGTKARENEAQGGSEEYDALEGNGTVPLQALSEKQKRVWEDQNTTECRKPGGGDKNLKTAEQKATSRRNWVLSKNGRPPQGESVRRPRQEKKSKRSE